MGDRARGAEGGLRQQVKAALARWVVHKRRALFDADRGRPDAHDEATHPWDGRRRFAEDYSFAAVQADLGLLVRLEWLPGRLAHRLWVMLLRDDEAWWVPPAQTLITHVTPDHWHVAGLELDCLQPLARWSVRYCGGLARASDERAAPGRCELALEFVASGAPFVPGVDDDPELIARHLGEAEWDSSLLRAVRRATQRGYVQLGRMRGTVALGDALLRVDAVSLRQHTWGVRDWGAPERAVQCLVAGPDATSWVQRAEFPAFTLEGGFVADAEGARCIAGIRAVEQREGVCRLELDTIAGPRRWSASARRVAGLRVDGRGAFELAWIRGADGTSGLWATQCRTLPRVPALR